MGQMAGGMPAGGMPSGAMGHSGTMPGIHDRNLGLGLGALVNPIGPISSAKNPPMGNTIGPPGRGLGPPGPPGERFPMPSTSSLLPDQEFIPINTDSPSLDRIGAFGDTPFTSSLFSSPFGMFGPVTSYGGENPGESSGSGLLADLHAGSRPVDIAPRRRSDHHDRG